MQNIHGRRLYELAGEQLIGIRVQKTNRDAQGRDENIAGASLPELRICGNVSRPE